VKDFSAFNSIDLMLRAGLLHKKAEYRRVDKYYKTSKQYWKERNRRREILRLIGENLTQREIAERLGVSERTVKRDVAKLRPYQERKFRHQMDLLKREWDERLETELAGKTELQKLNILTQKCSLYNKALKMREYYHHQMYVTIDLDKILCGFPEVRIWPQKQTNFKMPITLNLRFVKNKKVLNIGNTTLSYRTN